MTIRGVGMDNIIFSGIIHISILSSKFSILLPGLSPKAKDKSFLQAIAIISLSLTTLLLTEKTF